MGLLTKEVEVSLGARNIKHYENLGYIIPKYYNKNNSKYMVKRGTSLLVRVDDLPIGSNVLVNIECDNCGKLLKWTYADYNYRNHDGKCYCKRCGKIVFCSRENNFNWNPNKTDEERIRRRGYPEYVDFVKKVLARDNYSCQCCGKHDSRKMEVHHLYGYSGFPQYRVDQTQAITLCQKCHGAFHNWHFEKYGYINKGNCTRADYEEWIGYAINKITSYNGKLATTKKVFDYETGIIYDGAYKCATDLNVNNSSVYNCCNHKEITNKKLKDGTVKEYKAIRRTVKGHHLFWLEEYNKLTEEEIKEYINTKQKC